MINLSNIMLLFLTALINGDILYMYLKEFLNGEENASLIDVTIKDKNYWFIKTYSIITMYLSFHFFENWYMFYLFASIMLIILYYDYLERIIPNDIILALLFIIPVFHFINGSLELNILWGTIPAFSFILLIILMPGSMGMGDIKLFFVLGLFFSVFDMVYIVMISSLVAIFFYMFELLVLRDGKDHTLAYGPYIMLSIFLVSLV